MDITNAQSLGALVRDARNAQGLSQTQLAQTVGTTRQWLSRFEQGSNDVSLALAFAVLSELGITLRESGDDEISLEGAPEATDFLPSESDVEVTEQGLGGSHEPSEAPVSIEIPESPEASHEMPALDQHSHPTKRQSIPSLMSHTRRRVSVPPAAPSAMSAQAAVTGISSTSGDSAKSTSSAPSSIGSSASSPAPRANSSARTAEYSIDADIARIAKSSLFKKNR